MLVVAASEGGQGLGQLLVHAHPAGARAWRATVPSMNARSCCERVSPHVPQHDVGQERRGHDPGRHGVLPVVAEVRDPVGPAHDLALGRGRRGARPRVVADAVERLLAQVEPGQRDVRAPDGVVEPLGQEDPERVLAHVPARPVPAVVAEGDGLGQRHVEPARPGDARRHLGHLEGVAEPGPLVVGGEDEDLGLARQAPEGRRVQDAVPVAFEAGAPGVGLLGHGASARRRRPGSPPGRGPGPRPPRARRGPRLTGAALGWRRGRPTSRRGPCAGPGRRGPAMVAAQRRPRSVVRDGGRLHGP